MQRFDGFGPKALPFFEALAFHQDRDWFQENKALYESDVRDPLVALVEDLAEALPAAGVPLRGDARSLFRLNRDIRFSSDKSPYKTHGSAVLTRSGTKKDNGLLYIHIDPKGSFVAAGFHMLDPAGLSAMRNSIRRKPADYQAMVKALARGKLELGTEQRLSRLPRGYEDMKGTPVEDAFRLKSFIVETPFDAADLPRPALENRIIDFARRAQPLLDFGWKALGVTP